MQLIAMGQFEKMIRYDAQLRNHGRFSVYTHPAAHDDSLAVVYIEVNNGACSVLGATRLTVKTLLADDEHLTALVRRLEEEHGKTFHNGLMALTARYERYTAEFTKLLDSKPLSAVHRVINDALGFDIEYHSYANPQSIKMTEGVYLNEAANWIQRNDAMIRSYIYFRNDGEEFTVLGRQFREESFLMLSSYNPSKHMAYFDGMVGGRPVHQRIALNPKDFQGDAIFIDHMRNTNIVSEYGTLWRIRHLGYNMAETGEGFIRGPHIAGRGYRTIPKPDEHDFVENRIIVL
ncbi:hypothetical protein pEaSNUABM37_00199 [Erwinia phage pEa_SNUABM_37]|nr:hypothetical protein pEaSNUABM37_00199 [Erwinia phage pEa_SNUABM_37]QXO10669.1 hypothetical protein pEaSNUABM48_00199 [Erwinia phage pEa_SNUABM_48]